MIVCQDLYVTYKWRQEPVLKGVNGTFKGKSLILGPNGSGKTTLFRAICGLTNITTGKILIDGKPVEEIYATKGVVSANFQEIYSLIDVRAFELIRLYTGLAEGDLQLALKIIEDFGITTDFLKKRKLGELSSGQAKIFCMALALAMKAKHVLLDEPFQELDPARKGMMVNFLNEYDGVVLIDIHETWLLKNLQDWKAFLMFEGNLYGPLMVRDLFNVRISTVEEPNPLLQLRLSNKTVNLVKGKDSGRLLTSLENLDKIYEIARD